MNLTRSTNATSKMLYMAPIVKQKPCKDLRFSKETRKPASILDQVGQQGAQANGIKKFAWLGVPADSDGKLTHHYDKKFNKEFERR